MIPINQEDAVMMMQAHSHIGSQNMDHRMTNYVFGRTKAGAHIIKLDKQWEKISLAARAICAVDNPADVVAIARRDQSQRAVLKFGRYTRCTPIAGRYTPGTFTNQSQKAYREPRLLIVNDPISDHQPIKEASFMNIPVIAFSNVDSPLSYVDIVIPCNNLHHHSIGLMWWMLAREVLRIRGELGRDYKWNVMVDLFFYRDIEKEQAEQLQQIQAAAAAAAQHQQTHAIGQGQLTSSGAPGQPMMGAMDLLSGSGVPTGSVGLDGQHQPEISTFDQEDFSGDASAAGVGLTGINRTVQAPGVQTQFQAHYGTIGEPKSKDWGEDSQWES